MVFIYYKMYLFSESFVSARIFQEYAFLILSRFRRWKYFDKKIKCTIMPEGVHIYFFLWGRCKGKINRKMTLLLHASYIRIFYIDLFLRLLVIEVDIQPYIWHQYDITQTTILTNFEEKITYCDVYSVLCRNLIYGPWIQNWIGFIHCFIIKMREHR